MIKAAVNGSFSLQTGHYSACCDPRLLWPHHFIRSVSLSDRLYFASLMDCG